MFISNRDQDCIVENPYDIIVCTLRHLFIDLLEIFIKNAYKQRSQEFNGNK